MLFETLESRRLFSVVSLTADSTKILTLAAGETLHGNGHKVGGLTGTDVSGVSVDNLVVTGTKGDGVDLISDSTGTAGLTLTNISVSGFTKGYGILVETLGSGLYSNISLSGIRASSDGIAGISTWGAKGTITQFSLSTSVAYNNAGISGNNGPSGSGIMLAGLNGAIVSNCEAYNNGSNNNASSGPVGIWAYESNNVTISNCYSHDNKTRAKNGGGFDLDGGVTNSTIINCYSYNNAGYGYAAFTYTGSDPNSNNFFTNNISNNDAEGFYYWSAGPTISNLTLSGNRFINERSGITVLASTGSQYSNIIVILQGQFPSLTGTIAV